MLGCWSRTWSLQKITCLPTIWWCSWPRCLHHGSGEVHNAALMPHTTQTKECPRLRKETAVLKQMIQDNSTLHEASAVVRRRRSRQGRKMPARSRVPVTPPLPSLPPPITPATSSQTLTAQLSHTDRWYRANLQTQITKIVGHRSQD